MATSKIGLNKAVMVCNVNETYTDNAFFNQVVLRGYKFANIAFVSLIVYAKAASTWVTLPISLPAEITPSVDVHAPAVVRSNTTTTAVNFTTGGQIKIDEIKADTWYNVDICYII